MQEKRIKKIAGYASVGPAKKTPSPRVSGGIAGKNKSKINPIYREQDPTKIPGFRFGKGTE